MMSSMQCLPLAVFGHWDVVVVLGYFALVTVVGLAVARKDQDEKEIDDFVGRA